MHSISVLWFVMVGLSSGQTTTISLFIPGADTQPLVGSIIASDATATTYALQCVAGTDASDCGFEGPFTLTEGPTTAALTYSALEGTQAFIGYQACSLAGTTSAVCVESNGGSEANDPGISTETLVATDMIYMPVMITSGSKPLETATTTKTSSTARTTSKASSSSTNTGTSGGAAQTSSVKVSIAGVPAVTGNARWAVGAIAAAGLGLIIG